MSTARIERYQIVTLYVDLIDARSRTLVWAGRAETTLEQYPTPEEIEEIITKTVTSILEQYPPGSSPPTIVNPDFDRNAEFGRYLAYTWLRRDDDNTPVETAEFVKAEVASLLKEKRMHVNDVSPDIYVNYYVTGDEAIEVRRVGSNYDDAARFSRPPR